jgi:hypothetical protein
MFTIDKHVMHSNGLAIQPPSTTRQIFANLDFGWRNLSGVKNH